MICMNRLTKRYGRTLALDALDLTIGEGELHGMIGPNGAGKTTALKILATLMRPTSGDATICGVSVTREAQRARALMGYVPDFFGVMDNLKAWEYLDFYAACTGMSAKARKQRIGELLELVNLEDKRDAYVDGLSRGMKQRLCLARAMMHDPKLLILDEPASGMDPRARAEMREALRRVGQTGKTVLISSHILPELAQLCDHMTILDHGRAAFCGTVEALSRKMRGEAPLSVCFDGTLSGEQAERAHALLTARGAQNIAEAPDGAWRMALGGGTDAALLAELVAAGLPVRDFHREHATLESVFMEVTKPC